MRRTLHLELEVVVDRDDYTAVKLAEEIRDTIFQTVRDTDIQPVVMWFTAGRSRP